MTKKIFVAIFLCMASLSICYAQKSTFKQELAVGASFGLNFSSVSFAPKVPTKMKLGFNGGSDDTLEYGTQFRHTGGIELYPTWMGREV